SILCGPFNEIICMLLGEDALRLLSCHSLLSSQIPLIALHFEKKIRFQTLLCAERRPLIRSEILVDGVNSIRMFGETATLLDSIGTTQRIPLSAPPVRFPVDPSGLPSVGWEGKISTAT